MWSAMLQIICAAAPKPSCGADRHRVHTVAKRFVHSV
jgi:hypothetical protein